MRPPPLKTQNNNNNKAATARRAKRPSKARLVAQRSAASASEEWEGGVIVRVREFVFVRHGPGRDAPVGPPPARGRKRDRRRRSRERRPHCAVPRRDRRASGRACFSAGEGRRLLLLRGSLVVDDAAGIGAGGRRKGCLPATSRAAHRKASRPGIAGRRLRRFSLLGGRGGRGRDRLVPGVVVVVSLLFVLGEEGP